MSKEHRPKDDKANMKKKKDKPKADQSLATLADVFNKK